MNLEDFAELVRARRATRRFKPDPVPAETIEQILNAARWAPSGYNLQPTHFVVVTEQAARERLYPACLNQNQILEAPVVVVFCGDRRVKEHHLEAVLHADKEAGAIDAAYEERLRTFTALAFDQGPLGIGWLWKATLPSLGRLFRPIPSIPAVHKEYWVAKQVMLSAMVFMLAAQAAGLATCPMEGFDASRVRKALGIPRYMAVAVLSPLGYAQEGAGKKTRLPLANLKHENRW